MHSCGGPNSRERAHQNQLNILTVCAGEITSGNAATVGGKVDSNEICKDLRTAEEGSEIQAVVLRNDSSGPSPATQLHRIGSHNNQHAKLIRLTVAPDSHAILDGSYSPLCLQQDSTKKHSTTQEDVHHHVAYT